MVTQAVTGLWKTDQIVTLQLIATVMHYPHTVPLLAIASRPAFLEQISPDAIES